jgi:hypothetical protein
VLGYPLKTSRRRNQLWCGIPCFLSDGRHCVHVFSLVKALSLFILLVAVTILSMVSLSFITRFHLFLIGVLSVLHVYDSFTS